MRNRQSSGRILGSLMGVALAAAIAAVAGVGTALAANRGVDIAGFSFSPQELTVAVGDTVTWTNSDAQRHTATADDGSFDTGPIAAATPASVTFSTAGTFAYHCKIHPQMTATIVVSAAASGGGTPPATDTSDPVRPGSMPVNGAVVAAGALAVAWLLGFALVRRRLALARREG